MTPSELDAQFARAIAASNESFDLLVACQEKLRAMLRGEEDYDAPAVKHLAWLTRETVKLAEVIRQLARRYR